MPAMSWIERRFCQSHTWDSISVKSLQWVVQQQLLQGDILEIGSGDGRIAREILEQYPAISTFTATDIDPLMIDKARAALPSSAILCQADATDLPFADNSFDTVVSCIMLHHVIKWEDAISEIHRVLRPGGRFIGYDLVKTIPTTILHKLDGSSYRMLSPDDFVATCGTVGFGQVEMEKGGLGQAMRFSAVRI